VEQKEKGFKKSTILLEEHHVKSGFYKRGVSNKAARTYKAWLFRAWRDDREQRSLSGTTVKLEEDYMKSQKGQQRFMAIFLAVVMAFFFMPSGVSYAATTPSTTETALSTMESMTDQTVKIIHTNDMHGSLNTSDWSIGVDLTAGIRAANEHSLLFDAGDSTQGNALASLSDGADVITLMNAAGYDASALGNHEFDYGLATLYTNVQNADFPFLASNVIKAGKPLLEGLSYDGGTKINNGSYTFFEVDGLKIGVYGITTPETLYKTNPKILEGITFEDPTATSQKMIQTLQDQGADVIVCLAHLGVEALSEPANTSVGMANALGEDSGLDIIIDGHSHTAYPAAKTKGILIQQTGHAAAMVGEIGVQYKDGVLTTSGSLIDATTAKTAYTPVETVSEAVNAVLAADEVKTAPVIGQTKTALWSYNTNGFAESRIGETNLGDLVADAMVASSTSFLKGTSDQSKPVVALINGGALRTNIEPGEVTVGACLDVLPFGNTLALKEVTPQILYEVLEHSVSGVISQDSTTGQIIGSSGCFAQISGMTVVYNPNAVVGNRIVSITLAGETTPLDQADQSIPIVLASNDYIVDGGDGYSMLTGLNSLGEVGLLEEIFADYITTLTETNGSVNQPIWEQRMMTTGSYVQAAYEATITVMSETDLGNRVEYTIDQGAVQTGYLDQNGSLNLMGLSDGPHAICIGDGQAVLVNNYSGSGTTDAYPVSVQVTSLLIDPVKGESTLVINDPMDKVYDGAAVDIPKDITQTGSQNAPTFKWFVQNGDTWEALESAPIEVGTYKVVASVLEDDAYQGVETEKSFAISAQEMVVKPSTQNPYTGTVQTTFPGIWMTLLLLTGMGRMAYQRRRHL